MSLTASKNCSAHPWLTAWVHCPAHRWLNAWVHCPAHPWLTAQVHCSALPWLMAQVHCSRTLPHPQASPAYSLFIKLSIESAQELLHLSSFSSCSPWGFYLKNLSIICLQMWSFPLVPNPFSSLFLLIHSLKSRIHVLESINIQGKNDKSLK